MLVGDVHVSDRPPSLRTDGYTDQILGKLIWIVDQANEAKVDALVFAGDLFHIKTPSRNSHSLVLRVADILGLSLAPVAIVPGNHDMQHDRLDSLESQPLGVLTLHPNITLLLGRHRTLELYGIPYLPDPEVQLAKWFRGHPPEMDNFFVVTHASIFPNTQHPPYEHMSQSQWADYMPDEAWGTYYGHIHDPHGWKEVDGHLFGNMGAISRGSLHESSLKRKPQVSILDLETHERTVLDVPHLPAAEVFRLTEKQLADEKKATLDGFLEAVGTTKLSGLSLEEVRQRAREAGLSDLAVRTVEECCEGANS